MSGQNSKFKKNEIRPSIFSDNNGMNLDINNKRETGKLMNIWKSTLSRNNQWVKRERGSEKVS